MKAIIKQNLSSKIILLFIIGPIFMTGGNDKKKATNCFCDYIIP